ncbi:MAG TPA: tRNA (N(6)-L-threonylcarbamoyladenosine(37)-C(2))-methylthiotransferase MtaB [Candidatus Wallbacteria bacterium]|nr:MAG: Threonylcarbamoyladenosine tRNA methylthiotransferase MtaB [bacterium ADurb.Bin243]HOD39213.1 tRNA (N(6)-L-threonylcarbamoyladenosine(37)-C(2))-methylthiotransferase MtaB [Candidatus Wallbacteria bacterium]HPG58320.1 tRNA (N(6)-L-threonylcarbamoyladenosine(37)-C(2))-methylthiotransferase MtaB [Candidatus Wallbacteria bacterium]
MSLKFAITTLGCKVNQCEQKEIASLFVEAGFGEAGMRERADVYIINSCAITREAENKARQIASSVKGRFPEAVVALAGCYASRLGDEKLKNIDIYVSQADKKKIVEICARYLSEKNTRAETAHGYEKQADDKGPAATQPKTRAQLKIQDGCKSFCSYCIVPYIRTEEYSMPPDEVIRQIVTLSAAGFSEIVLTGIHVGKYAVNDIYGNLFGFENLLQTLDLYPFEKEFRIRISSIDPCELSEKIIYLIKNSPRFAPHFHVALQSGSDRILKAMNRRYGRAEFIEKIKLIESNIELAAITSDVIVGFPGESEEDFMDTYNLLNEFNFYDFHIFQYSDRPGTAASRIAEKVDPAVKKERSRILHELKYKKNSIYYKNNIGREAFVIPEKILSKAPDGSARLSGHSERYIETAFDGRADMAGKIVKVRLVSASEVSDGMNAVLTQ